MNDQAIHLMVTVVDRGRSEKVIAVCHEAGVPLHMVSLGHGTARTEMLDLLGIGETGKDIVLSLVPERTLCPLLDLLANRMKMRYPGKGISFAIPLSSVSGRTYRALTEMTDSDTERMSWFRNTVARRICQNMTSASQKDGTGYTTAEQMFGFWKIQNSFKTKKEGK